MDQSLGESAELVFIDVTPEMAESYLSQFQHNRTSSQEIIDKYARMMQAGQWLRAGEPVGVTVKGEYINGMHRFKAIVQAGRTVALPFQFGMDPDARKVIDTGRGRQYKHFLQIEGVDRAAVLGPLVRRMFLWDSGIFYGPSRGAGRLAPSPMELDTYLADHPELREVAALSTGPLPPNIKTTAYGVLATIFGRISTGARDEFCTAWLTGADLSAGHPVLALRDRLARDAATKTGRFAEEKIALGCAAWNAFREGRSLTKMQLPAGFDNDHYPHPR